MRATTTAITAMAIVFSGNAFADLTTTGTFSRWFGDVGDPTVWEVYVNDVVVTNNLPDVNNFPQGEIVFAPPRPNSVEFKSKQIGLPDFNTPTAIAFVGTTQANPGSASEAFQLGTISLTNGIFFFQAAVDITVTTSSDNATFDAKSFNDTLQYVVTPNTGTDEVNADYAFFVGRPDLGQIRVYEAASAFPNTGSIELWGRVGSLIPTEFRNASGGVFVQAIPEPATYALMLLGLAAAGIAARRR
jgi:PEP-CTERM motif